jgi:hypothetical protein
MTLCVHCGALLTEEIAWEVRRLRLTGEPQPPPLAPPALSDTAEGQEILVRAIGNEVEQRLRDDLEKLRYEETCALNPIDDEIASLTGRIREAPSGDTHSAEGRRDLSRIRRFRGWLERMEKARRQTLTHFDEREKAIRERLRHEGQELIISRLGRLPEP